MNTTLCARLAGSISGQVLAMEPEALRVAANAIGLRLGIEARHDDGEGRSPSILERTRAAYRQRLAMIGPTEAVEVGEGVGEYALTVDGVAIVPVLGTLVARWDWLAAWCGLTSYDALTATIGAAIDDPRVRGIMLDIDSPGGIAAGMLDCADRIRAASEVKPLWAHANALAASAACGIGTAPTRLSLPRMGNVGSVGVVSLHVDQSAADEQRGLRYTALYSGAQKIDGWGHAPLPDDVRARFQARLDASRLQFATAVAGYRGLAVDTVMQTEAALLQDYEAVNLGLADAVESFDEALAALTASLSAGGSAGITRRGPAATSQKEVTMGKTPDTRQHASADDDKDECEDETEGGDQEAGTDEDGGDGDDDEDAAEEDENEGDDVKAARGEAAAIAKACAAAGKPQLAAGFISKGVPLATVKKRLGSHATIRKLVADAMLANPNIKATVADALIEAGASVAEAKSALFNAIVTGQAPAIRGVAPEKKRAALGGIDTRAVYGAYNKR
ncbi:S49 family peptidase [Nitrospirillum viridazoti]|uniref:Peptidase S49 domain-containing protein n=1 Tax=Nitrospirillum viridazoti CBAmc TaxID=1441467 RepID=A0A248JT37_9PROT|nr:S49 family peptidase [Nitrospirillum amazonense]ASG21404.1 hypothetical protein Y958_11620 [Nitrospirillum amazonense CBAmc]TWB33082.1 ClpP class serine protease [Nitrospirillum amazonense]